MTGTEGMTGTQPFADDEFAQMLCLAPGEHTHDVAAGSASDAELAAVQAAIGAYRTESLQWAERRSAGQPSLAARASRQERWAALPQWSLALIALVTIAGGVAHVAGSRDTPETIPASSADVTATPAAERALSPAEIAADNRLLSSIAAELNYDASSPVDALGLHGKAASSSVGTSGDID